jgi:glucose-1-phosphate thymidylyltransferase
MQIKKGILLAAGTGSRLMPLTGVVNKHLISIHNKFIIDYPINTLKQMGIKQITVVIGGEHYDQVVYYLKNGANHGVSFNFVYQEKASGIAHAVALCEPYVEYEEQFVAVLGDNVFQSPIRWSSKHNIHNPHCAKIALYKHPELNRFGVASIDNKGKITKLQEKPQMLDDKYEHYAITGCYVFDREYFNMFRHIKPSARGEFEIVDIIRQYLDNDALEHTVIKDFWSDAGQFDSIDQCRQVLR